MPTTQTPANAAPKQTYTVSEPNQPREYDLSVCCGVPLLVGSALKSAPSHCQSRVGCNECERCGVHCRCD